MKKRRLLSTARRRGFLEELVHNRLFYLMILPGLVLLFVFNYIPMYGLVMAFQHFSPGLGFFRSRWVGLENYRFLLDLPDMGRVLRNTVLISVSKILLRQLVAVTFAILLNELRIRWLRRTIQTFSYLPHFLSWVILGGVFVVLLARTGPVNRLLGAFGLEPVYFLGSDRWFRPTIIATDVWQDFGFASIVYLAALTGIDLSLYESAVMDGARRLRQIRHITLPGIASTMILLAVLSLGQIMNAGFEQILVLYNPAVYETGDIIDTWIYRFGLEQARYSLGAAVGLFKSLIGLTLVLLSNFLADRLAGYRVF